MNTEDRQKLREAFLAAANSPAADRYLDHGDHKHYIADMLRAAADDERLYDSLDQAIAEGKTTVDKTIESLVKAYPPAP